MMFQPPVDLDRLHYGSRPGVRVRPIPLNVVVCTKENRRRVRIDVKGATKISEVVALALFRLSHEFLSEPMAWEIRDCNWRELPPVDGLSMDQSTVAGLGLTDNATLYICPVGESESC